MHCDMEDGMRWFILIQLGFSAVLLMLLSIPMALGSIGRNSFYGLRTKKTLSSDEVWYPANRYAGKALLIGGAVSLAGIAALAAAGRNLSLGMLSGAGFVLLMAPVIVAAVASIRFAGRLQGGTGC